jgi:hypothetical protein
LPDLEPMTPPRTPPAPAPAAAPVPVLLQLAQPNIKKAPRRIAIIDLYDFIAKIL